MTDAGMEVKRVIAEVVEPEESLPRDLRGLLAFARLLDEAVTIPGTRRKIGLDAAIGLIPGVGDAVGAVFSLAIVVGAIRHRVPLPTVGRMVWNILLDLVIGLVPVIGDVFDLLFAENVGNVQLLIKNRDRSRPPRSWSTITTTTVLMVGFVLFLSVVVAIAGVWLILWLIAQR